MRIRLVMFDEELRQRLHEIRAEHRDLDATIALLIASDDRDQLQIARLKKRKLALKDQALKLENMLIPDILA